MARGGGCDKSSGGKQKVAPNQQRRERLVGPKSGSSNSPHKEPLPKATCENQRHLVGLTSQTVHHRAVVAHMRDPVFNIWDLEKYSTPKPHQ